MGMPVQDRHWTAEMARALPDDGCYEVLDGELFLSPTPSRNHQRAVKEPCSVSTHTFGRMRSANWALPADIEFSLGELLQP